MLELVPVAFQSTPLLVLLLTLQGMGTLPMEATVVKRLRGRKRGPDDWIRGKRMLQRPNELREIQNHMSRPQRAKLYHLAQLVRLAAVGINAMIFSAQKKRTLSLKHSMLCQTRSYKILICLD